MRRASFASASLIASAFAGLALVGSATAHDLIPRQISFRLLIGVDDPSTLRAGSRLRVKVLFERRALRDQQITAYSRAGEEVFEHGARTDARGIVSLPIERDGSGVSRTVHMRACDGCEDADWESFWASLTFGVCASPPPASGYQMNLRERATILDWIRCGLSM